MSELDRLRLWISTAMTFVPGTKKLPEMVVVTHAFSWLFGTVVVAPVW